MMRRSLRLMVRLLKSITAKLGVDTVFDVFDVEWMVEAGVWVPESSDVESLTEPPDCPP